MTRGTIKAKWSAQPCSQNCLTDELRGIDKNTGNRNGSGGEEDAEVLLGNDEDG